MQTYFLMFSHFLENDVDFNYHRGGFVPCNSQLPTLRSVSTPEEDLVSNLPTCFPTNCACRKTERLASISETLNVIVRISSNKMFQYLQYFFIFSKICRISAVYLFIYFALCFFYLNYLVGSKCVMIEGYMSLCLPESVSVHQGALGVQVIHTGTWSTDSVT